jgi:hypothetical protein
MTRSRVMRVLRRLEDQVLEGLGGARKGWVGMESVHDLFFDVLIVSLI